MTEEGFESLVIQELGHLQESISTLAALVGNLNVTVIQLGENQKQTDRRREALMGPLTSWSVDDSVRLKKILSRDRVREEQHEEVTVTQTARDHSISRWRDRVVLIGSAFGLLAGLGLRVSDVLASIRHTLSVIH